MRKLLSILTSFALAITLVPAVFSPNAVQAAEFDSSWKAITSAQNITESGNYYLANDVAFDSYMEIAALSADVTLDLNGHSITFNEPSGKTDSRCLYVRANTKLVLQDSASGGKITGSIGWYDPKEESWNGGGVYVDYGALTMKSGTITGCMARGGGDGGGVYVDTNGSFTMTGGTIESCEAGSGGGVYVDTNGSFTMTGGTIENCGPKSIGGSGSGVYVGDGGSFTMEGGTIQNCITSNGGVLVNGSATFTMRPARVEAPPTIKGSKDYRGNASSDVVLSGNWTYQTVATMYAEGGTIEGDVSMPQLATIDHRADAGSYTQFNGNVKTGSHRVTITDAAKMPVVFQADDGTPASQTLRTLNGQKLDTTPQAPTRQGYVFAGWKQSNILGGEAPFDFDAPVTQGFGQFAQASWSKNIAEATVELDKSEFTYNGESQGPHVTRVYYPGGGAEPAYSVTGQGSAVNVGTYTLSITGQGQVLGNTSKSVSWEIKKADQTIEAQDKTVSYGTTTPAKIGARISGRAAKDGSGIIKYEVIEGADVISVSSDGTITTKQVGTAKVKMTAQGDSNYNDAPEKVVTIRVEGNSDPGLNGSDWPYKIDKTVYVNDTVEDADLVGGTAPASVPGTYSIVGPRSWSSSGLQQVQMRFTPTDPNYKTVEKTLSNFYVYKRPVMGIVSPQMPIDITNKPYGTNLEDLGLPKEVTIEAGDENNKKEYMVPVTWRSASSYTYSNTSLNKQDLTGTLDLSSISNEVTNNSSVPASATVTLQKLLPEEAVFTNKTATYNGAPISHELETLPQGAQSARYTYEGTGDTTYPASDKAPTLPGTYQVTASLTARNNYETPANATAILTINKKSVTVTAYNKEAVVNSTAPSLENPTLGSDYSVEGLVSGDTLNQGASVKLSYASIPDMSKEGTYAIKISVTGNDPRYTFETKDGRLNVVLNHTHNYEWRHNAREHWLECTCGDTKDRGTHTFGVWTTTKKATTTTQGERTRTCSVCGYEQTEVIPLVSPTDPEPTPEPEPTPKPEPNPNPDTPSEDNPTDTNNDNKQDATKQNNTQDSTQTSTQSKQEVTSTTSEDTQQASVKETPASGDKTLPFVPVVLLALASAGVLVLITGIRRVCRKPHHDSSLLD